MSIDGATVHRPPGCDPARIRLVQDGFHWSVFLIPPAALFARRLWLAGLGWIAFVAVVVALVVAGLLVPGAALLAVIVVNIVLALDAADLERRRLMRRGWSTIAVVGPLGIVDVTQSAVAATPVAGSAPPKTTDIIGLFPS